VKQLRQRHAAAAARKRDTLTIMPNGLKTALLLGLLSGLLLVIGDLLGGANGILIAFIIAR
jgi:hypothetical protein